MASIRTTRDRMDIVKYAVAHFVSHYLSAFLPVAAPSPTANAASLSSSSPSSSSASASGVRSSQPPPRLYTDAGSSCVIEVDTEAMCLLAGDTFAPFKSKLKLRVLEELVMSRNQDAATLWRYAQRTTTVGRDMIFHFVFSDRQLAALESGKRAADEEKTPASATTTTNFMWVLCPRDLIAKLPARHASVDERDDDDDDGGDANAVNGNKAGRSYDLHTSYAANARILDYLQRGTVGQTNQQRTMETLVRCGAQLGDYQSFVDGGNSGGSVFDLIVTRDSIMHNTLIGMFCQAECVYGAINGSGRTFATQLTEMHQRAGVLMLNGGGGGGGGGGADDDGAAIAKARMRTLILRASLDKLEDDVVAEHYVATANAYLSTYRQPYGAMDAEYTAHVSEAQHRAKVDHVIGTFKKAWQDNGFVCGMINFVVDPRHEALYILDAFVHPGFVRRARVISALRASIRSIACDEAVHTIFVLAPTCMDRETALPIYDALFRTEFADSSRSGSSSSGGGGGGGASDDDIDSNAPIVTRHDNDVARPMTSNNNAAPLMYGRSEPLRVSSGATAIRASSTSATAAAAAAAAASSLASY